MTRPAARLRAPYLGQHTDEVLEELPAMDEAERRRLRETGVIG